jgi:hypothetical protein
MKLGIRWDAKQTGAIACTAGLVLLADPGLVLLAAGRAAFAGLELFTLALALECIALAFWCWARASADATNQVRRWTWLRRPAQAMWLAAAAEALLPHLVSGSSAAPVVPLIAASASVWAGLELMAALPIARPYSDLAGPLLAMRPWLPALLPAVGFVVLWRTAALWTDVPVVRGVTVALLLVTALLATLRAFGRRQWATALRWLTVSESALAAVLVATRIVPEPVSMLLWLGSCGGRSFMLAGELRGATPRRGAALSRLWRTAGWLGSAALAWPLLTALIVRALPSLQTPSWITIASMVAALVAAIAVMLTAYVSVRRVVKAPERRLVMRADSALTLSHVSALLTLLVGPLALGGAWLAGVRLPLVPSLLAMIPAAVGGTLAIAGAPRRSPLISGIESAGGRARRLARMAFRFATSFERRVIEALARALRAGAAPLWELHTGDAQEYLLFLVGLSVLALVLPFLR